MLAVRFYGIGDVRTEEVDFPEQNKEHAVIRVLYGGICGSDLHIFRKGMFVEKIPEIMGHEFIGRIESAPLDSPFHKGDLVVGDPRVPCGKCVACVSGDFHRCAALGFIGEVRPGCFAQYVSLEPQRLIRIDSNVSLKQAALAEPLAVAIHACRAIVPVAGAEVLVVGAGPIGLLITSLLKKRHSISRVTVMDIDAFRREKALRAGADEVCAMLDGEKRYSCIIDAVGVPAALESMLLAAAPGGRIFISAIYEKLPEVDMNTLVAGELTMTGNNAYSFEDLEEAVRVIEEGNLDFSWMITRTLPAKEAPHAFQLLTAKEKCDIKILLDFQ